MPRRGVVHISTAGRIAILAPLVLVAAAPLAQAGPTTPTCQGQEASKARFLGGEDADTIIGTNDDDVIIGLGGYDTIDGKGGDDLICGDVDTFPDPSEDDGNKLIGGSGRDLLIGDNGPDELIGGDSNDDLRSVDPELEDPFAGEILQNTLKGGDGNDDLRAGGADDVLKGGDDKDFLNGGPGEDDLFGGKGSDIDRSTDGEILYGLVGEFDEDDLFGGPGDDGLYGGDLEGLEGLNHGDTLDGGTGNDDLRGAFGVDTLDGGTGVDKLFGEFGNDDLFGDEGNDFLYGGPDLDEIRGGPDRDTIEGNDETDQLFGGGARDLIDGNDGNDTLRGEGGPDALDGGPDTDDCDGGGQADDTEQNCEAPPLTVTTRSASVGACGSGDNGETGGSQVHRPPLPVAGEWTATSVSNACPSSSASATQTSDVQASVDGSDWLDVDLGISNTANVWVLSQHRAHFFVSQPATLTCTGTYTDSEPGMGNGMIIWLDTGGAGKELLTAYNSQAINVSKSFSPGAAHTLWIRANNGGALTGTASVDVTCDFDGRVAIDSGD